MKKILFALLCIISAILPCCKDANEELSANPEQPHIENKSLAYIANDTLFVGKYDAYTAEDIAFSLSYLKERLLERKQNNELESKDFHTLEIIDSIDALDCLNYIKMSVVDLDTTCKSKYPDVYYIDSNYATFDESIEWVDQIRALITSDTAYIIRNYYRMCLLMMCDEDACLELDKYNDIAEERLDFGNWGYDAENSCVYFDQIRSDVNSRGWYVEDEIAYNFAYNTLSYDKNDKTKFVLSNCKIPTPKNGQTAFNGVIVIYEDDDHFSDYECNCLFDYDRKTNTARTSSDDEYATLAGKVIGHLETGNGFVKVIIPDADYRIIVPCMPRWGIHPPR